MAGDRTINAFFQSAGCSSSTLRHSDSVGLGLGSTGESSEELFCPAKRPKLTKDKRVFKEDWKLKYLMWPVGEKRGTDFEDSVLEMMCSMSGTVESQE